MMKTFAIATDSASSLQIISPSEKEVAILPLHISMYKENKRDFIDISTEDFLKWMQEYPDKFPSVSPPLDFEIETLFRRWIEQGYTEALFIASSSTLSKTGYSVKKIAEKFSDKLKVTIFDSRCYGYAQYLLIEEAKRSMSSGKSVTFTVTRLEMMRRRIGIFMTVHDTKVMAHNNYIHDEEVHYGLIKFNPIISVSDRGDFQIVDKSIGFSHALNECIDQCRRFIANKKAKVFISHFGGKNGKAFEEKVGKQFAQADIVSLAPPLILACHIGSGFYSIGACVE